MRPRIAAAMGAWLLAFASLTYGMTRTVDQIHGPYYTISSAMSGLKAGDQVVIAAGTYRESVDVACYGTTSMPITIRAADGSEGSVFIKGSDVYTNWSFDQDVSGGKRYKTSVSYTFEKSDPAPGASDYSRRVEMAFVDGVPYQQVLALSNCVAGTFYVPTRWKVDAPPTNDFFYIALSAANDPLADHTIEISTRQKGLAFAWPNWPSQDVEYVTIKGLTVMHVACGACPTWRKTMAFNIEGNRVTIDGCTASYNNWIGFMCDGTNSTITNCTASYNGMNGISGSPKGDLFAGNTTDYNGWRFENGEGWSNGGMKWVGLHDYIRDNTFDRCVSSHNQGPGIWFDFCCCFRGGGDYYLSSTVR